MRVAAERTSARLSAGGCGQTRPVNLGRDLGPVPREAVVLGPSHEAVGLRPLCRWDAVGIGPSA